jgi:hypothetical protein
MDQFAGARLKIGRADHHIDKLEARIFALYTERRTGN